MTVTSTARFALTIASTDDDAPINRVQLNDDYQAIEDRALIGLNGTLASRPPAGVRDRLFMVSSGAGAGVLWWDTGAAWVAVNGPKTVRLPHTFSVGGPLEVGQVLPGFYVPAPAGQTAKLAVVRYRIGSGTSVTVQLRHDVGAGLVDIPGVGSQVVAGTLRLDPADVTWTDEAFVEGYVTAVSGAPTNLTVGLLTEYSV